MTNARVSIQANNLVVRYSDLVALDIPRLELSGGVIALLGHNGAGKSTLLKTVLGLLEPLSGSVLFKRTDGTPLTPERDMAFCPENGAIFSDISVERYLQCWCRITRGDARYYRQKGSKYIELLSVSELLARKGRELSKGQRRRVQTALGFMGEPALFLFDEPFDGLDVQRTNDLMEIVEQEREKRSFLISSHRMDVMERLADIFIVLQHGQVACSGTVSEICETLIGASDCEGAIDLTDAMRIHLQHLRNPAVA